MREFKCANCFWVWYSQREDHRCPECGSPLIFSEKLERATLEL